MKPDNYMVAFWLVALIVCGAFWFFAIKSVLRLAAWAGAL